MSSHLLYDLCILSWKERTNFVQYSSRLVNELYTVLYTYSLIKKLGSNESKHYEPEIKKGLIDQTINIQSSLE